MQVRNRGRNRAFTLVEILIVVVILGILAAIVVPQFTNAANDARGGNITTQLQTLNSQVELYAARNNGAYPDLQADQWGALNDGLNTMIGAGYLKTAPLNPAWNPADNANIPASQVEVGAGAFGSATAAWFFNTDDNTLYASYYDEALGEITTNPLD